MSPKCSSSSRSLCFFGGASFLGEELILWQFLLFRVSKDVRVVEELSQWLVEGCFPGSTGVCCCFVFIFFLFSC